MKKLFRCLSAVIFLTAFSAGLFALNPLVSNIYTADPSAHVFENRVYVYSSHDKDNPGFFDMEDYHVFSSADMINWVDHGVALRRENVSWIAEPEGPDRDDVHPRMWGPDCVYKNGTYYFYFPARDKNNRFRIGVATSKSPSGPFVPVKYYGVESYMPGSFSTYPSVFMDDNGKVYMFFGGLGEGQLPDRYGHSGCPYWAEINTDNPGDPENYMIKFKTTPQPIQSGVDNWFETARVHKRNGMYYLSYSTGNNTYQTSEIHYSTSNSIAGPWLYRGCVIPKDNNFITGWTNHHSFLKYKDNWYAFYHSSAISGGDTQRRGMCVDRLYYNPDGTMREVIPTRVTNEIRTSAYSRIKAQFYSDMSGVGLADCSGNDIGKFVTSIHDDDMVYFSSIDFGSIGSKEFEARIGAESAIGFGFIKVYSITTVSGIPQRNLVGTLTVSNTGSWTTWKAYSCKLDVSLYGLHDIELRFTGGGGGNPLFNLNSFTFKPKVNIPIGHSVAFKSQNPNCLDNQGNLGQKYLCVDSNYINGLYANRNAVGGAWEKFSILARNNETPGSVSLHELIQLNSSNNGKNIRLWTPAKLPEEPTYLLANGGDYFSMPEDEYGYNESFSVNINFDGTVSFRNRRNDRLLCVDTRNNQNNPATCYANREKVGSDDNGLSWEKFYLEASDAPLGCLVGFKSQNPDSLGRDGKPAQQYLCVDAHNGNDLCANRPGIGGDWEQFEVVDAGNGYVALKSFNGNQFLNFDNPNHVGNANGGDTIDSEFEKFQWQNNGDGTISLWNVGARQYLCVDTRNGQNNPAKCYANRDAVGQNSNGISWEKFYCQIQVTGEIETVSEFSLPVPQYTQEKSQWCWIAVPQMIIHYFYPASTATQSEIFRRATGLPYDSDIGGDAQMALGGYLISSRKLWVTPQVWLQFSDIENYITNGQPLVASIISPTMHHYLLVSGYALKTFPGGQVLQYIKTIDPGDAQVHEYEYSFFRRNPAFSLENILYDIKIFYIP